MSKIPLVLGYLSISMGKISSFLYLFKTPPTPQCVKLILIIEKTYSCCHFKASFIQMVLYSRATAAGHLEQEVILPPPECPFYFY